MHTYKHTNKHTLIHTHTHAHTLPSSFSSPKRGRQIRLCSRPASFLQSYIGFLDVCKRCLRSENHAVRALPSSWLNYLLDLSTHPTRTVLRRSAGLPFCLLAILRAEPAGYPAVLLQHSMRFLLDHAEDATLPTSARVHSLNLLRKIIMDGTLGTDVDQFVEEAFQVVLPGFSSPEWSIKNSSMMCYTVLIRRAVVSSDRKTRLQSSGKEFFHRYPKLLPFILSTLQAAVESVSGFYISVAFLQNNVSVEPATRGVPFVFVFAPLLVSPLLSSICYSGSPLLLLLPHGSPSV